MAARTSEVNRDRDPLANSSNVIFISNLSADVTEDKLRAVFSPLGKLISCTLHEDHRFQKFARIKFNSIEEAESAVVLNQGYNWFGRESNLSFEHTAEDRISRNQNFHNGIQSSATRRVQVGNIPTEDRKALRKHFFNVGEVETVVTFRRLEENGLFYYFGFICFQTEEEAMAAQLLDGSTMSGNTITVRPYQPRKFAM